MPPFDATLIVIPALVPPWCIVVICATWRLCEVLKCCLRHSSLLTSQLQSHPELHLCPLLSMEAEQLPPDRNVAPAILFESYFLLAIATLLVALRCYVRVRITLHSWGWDDFTIIAAWVFLVIGAVLVNIETNLGMGRHLVHLENPERQALDILKFNTFYQMDNVVCTLLAKISISLYIMRIRTTPALRWTLAIIMTLMALATIAVIVVLSVSCFPLRKLWEPESDGRCLPLTTVYNLAYVQSAFTIVTDLALTISPVIILWNVQINWKKKTRICLLMSLGLVATISNALRNYFQEGLTKPDFTWTIVPVTVLAILELSSGVIAACIPACMPFFNLWKRKHVQKQTSFSESYSLNSRGSDKPQQGTADHDIYEALRDPDLHHHS